MKLKHFTELDGVRALAALMVMFFHFFQNLKTSDNTLLVIQKYAIFGQTGVSLFFVLSGFLITRILLNSKQSSSYFSTFYFRRSVRIFPLYYLFLIIFYFILPYWQNTPLTPLNKQIYYWVYLQNFAMTFRWPYNGPGHFWSLAVEEHFYLFWPLLVYFLDKQKIKISILIIIIIAFLTRFILIKNNLDVFYFTFSRMDELAVGALLAIWELEGKLKQNDSKKYLLACFAIIIPTLTLWMFTNGKGMDTLQISKFALLSFFYCAFIGWLITSKDRNWLKTFFRTKILIYLGRISYGLYVFHPICFFIIHKYFYVNSILISILLSFALTFLIATLSFYGFESRFLSLKKKFSYS